MQSLEVPETGERVTGRTADESATRTGTLTAIETATRMMTRSLRVDQPQRISLSEIQIPTLQKIYLLCV